MGEKCDNLLHAFNGVCIDWKTILGSGFDSAPRSWVSVYREASLDELLRIAKEGLSVPPPEMRQPEMRQEMEVLDQFRPPHIVKRGISRLRAIYAAPSPDDTPELPFRNERIMLEMRIDPADSYVGDMDFITCLIPFIGAQRYGLDKYHGAFKKYWDGVIPLREFRRHYIRMETGLGHQWICKASAAKGLPKNFFAPEILIMSQVISQRHIRILQDETSDEGIE
jgi:hypothetical protein